MRTPFAASAACVALTACIATGGDRSDEIAGPSARAYAYVVVSVDDMPQALSLWEERLGMEVSVSRRGADPGLSRIWGLGEDAIAEQALLNSPGMIDGGVHLVRFADAGEAVREGSAAADLGLLGLVVAAGDFDERRAAFLAAGTATETVSDGDRQPARLRMQVHDGIELLLQAETRSTATLSARGYTVALQLRAVVPDVEREAAFFREVLGLELLSPEARGTPTTLDVRVLGARDSRLGRLELVEYEGAEGRDLYPLTAPPARGLLSLTYVVPDLAPILERGRAAGIADHGTVRTILGEGHMASVTSPAGLRIDLVQL